MSEDQKKELIELPEEIIETPVEITEENTSPQEFKLAKKHGMVKEEKKDGEQSKSIESKTEDNPVKKEEVKEEHPSFEEVEAKEDLIEKYNKNEKALYWKWKTDKHKRQELQKEKDEIASKYELNKVKTSSYQQKLDAINKMLDEGGDNLTVEQLKKVIAEGREELEKTPPPAKSEVDVIREKINVKAQFAEKIGQAKYDNFQAIANLAKEVIAEDKTGTYQTIIDKAFTDDAIDENMLVERVVNIARFSPKFLEVSKSGNSEKQEEADKAVKNAAKKVSSASVTSSKGGRSLTEDELTVHDAARLSSDQWRKLNPKTKQRLLMGINP